MEQSSLRVHRENSPSGDVILRLAGEIDVSVASVLAEALQEAAASKPARLVVDMAAVNFMDSTGLAALIRANHEQTGHGGRVVVRNPRRP